MAFLLNSMAFVQLVYLRPRLGVLYKFRRPSWHTYIGRSAINEPCSRKNLRYLSPSDRRLPAYEHMHVHARTRAHIHAHTHIHARTRTDIHAYTHARTSTHIRTHASRCKSANAGFCSHMHTKYGESNIQKWKNLRNVWRTKI